MNGEPSTEPGDIRDTKVATDTTTSSEDQSNLKTNQPNEKDSTHTCTRSVTVHWDIPRKQAESHLSTSVSHSEVTHSADDSEHKRTPIPLPRTKPQKQVITDETNVQSLVTFSDNCNIQVACDSNPEDVSSNKYLKELLEVFSKENKCEENSEHQSSHNSQAEDVDAEMSTGHSQRDVRTRIQAFESQASDGNAAEPAKPQPLPRKVNKPPVAAKPSIALKPQLNHSVDTDYQHESNGDIPPNPAPAPIPPKKPVGLQVKEELETLLSKVPQRSRPPGLIRANSVYEVEPSGAAPTPPVKPRKEPLKPNLNINNHNSISISGEDDVGSPSSEWIYFKNAFFTRLPFHVRMPHNGKKQT